MTQYGQSWAAHRWRMWRRWWRHPQRELARRQWRRGMGFWRRPPWIYILLFIVIFKAASPFWMRMLFASGRPISPWIIMISYSNLIPSLLILIAWANCMQDEALHFFRGKRLGELLSTPAGPRHYFPTLLLAPIAAYGTIQAVSALINVATSTWWLLHRHVPESRAYLFPWFDRQMAWDVLTILWRVLLGYATQVIMMAGLTALAASITIGNGRMSALIRSILVAIGIYILLSIVTQLTVFFGYPARGGFSMPITVISYLNTFITVGIGVLLWRVGLRRLRGPGTIARLQKAMESAG